MNNDIINDNFIKALKGKYPNGSRLSKYIAQSLFIQKEAVYRRLRKEVPFTFNEVATLSREMGISLDKVLGIESEKTCPFQLDILNFIEPDSYDLAIYRKFVELLLLGSENSVYTEAAFACNTIPSVLYSNYKYLSKYYLFKWNYQYGGIKNVKNFKEVKLNEELHQMQNKLLACLHNMENTYFIWDKMMLSMLLNNIKYFQCINLIRDDEVKLIKKDIGKFLLDMEHIAANGVYPNTGKNVFLYISEINFDSNFSYVDTKNYKVSMFKASSLNDIISIDDKTFFNIKEWMQSLKRFSSMISVSGEKMRMQFFNEQRKLMETI